MFIKMLEGASRDASGKIISVALVDKRKKRNGTASAKSNFRTTKNRPAAPDSCDNDLALSKPCATSGNASGDARINQPAQAVSTKGKRNDGLPELVPLEKRRWLTIPQASIRFPIYSEKAFRHLVSQAEAYARHPKAGLRSNGFIGCIVRPAGQRKVLIDAVAFEGWLESFSVVSNEDTFEEN